MNDLPFPLADPLRNSARALARREDFRLGNAVVRPSLRTVEGPAGSAQGEPKVVQVLVALADARGRVLSRDDLLRLCWEGRIVGEDAVNRAIGEVRRLTAATGADFEVETVPRVGYRLAGIAWDAPEPPGGSAPAPRSLSRRTAIAWGAAAVVGVGGAGWLWRKRTERLEVAELVERGRALRASGVEGAAQQAEVLFTRAVVRDPGNAAAWGWLSVCKVGDGAVGDEQARLAAQRALALDPREPNARSTIAILRRDLDDWIRYEDQLLAIVRDAPDCAPAFEQLTLFLQSVGRCRDSLASNERAIAIEPFSPQHQFRRAMKLWIFGRVGEADKVADRLLQLRPRNANAWNARLIIYAFSGRPQAALAFLGDVASRPANLKVESIEAWRAGLVALASRSPADIAYAVAVNLRAATLAPGLAANAIMLFSALGELDSAYEVADGLLNNQGSLILQSRTVQPRAEVYASPVWGRTQFLFIPPTALFRADPRFSALCEQMGHTAYWRQRGIWPDPFVRGSLQVS